MDWRLVTNLFWCSGWMQFHPFDHTMSLETEYYHCHDQYLLFYKNHTYCFADLLDKKHSICKFENDTFSDFSMPLETNTCLDSFTPVPSAFFLMMPNVIYRILNVHFWKQIYFLYNYVFYTLRLFILCSFFKARIKFALALKYWIPVHIHSLWTAFLLFYHTR